MTLVIGRRFSKAVRLWADSKITDEQAVRGGTLRGALKLVVINRALCVGWAGFAVPAMDAIRQLLRSEPTPIHDVEDRLQDASLAADGNVAFLVASISDPISLTRIRGDELDREPEQLWIGDHAAFAAFQSHFLEPSKVTFPVDAFGGRQEMTIPPRPAEWYALFRQHFGDPEEYELGGRISDALLAVILDPEIASVDDPPIRVLGDWAMEGRKGFRYLSHVAQFRGEEQALAPGVETAIQFGKSAARGGYGYTILPPLTPGIGAIGVYFPQGRLGAFFHPRERDEPFSYPDVTQAAFEAAVVRDFAVRIGGPGLAEGPQLILP
jgi:hypothetical protein